MVDRQTTLFKVSFVNLANLIIHGHLWINNFSLQNIPTSRTG